MYNAGMTRPFKIFIGILAFVLFVPAFLYGISYFNTQLTTNRLMAVARELPKFDGESIAEGERGYSECYSSGGAQASCPAVTLKLNLDIETGWQRAHQFIVATKKAGVRWSNLDTERSGFIHSNGFDRGDHTYLIFIDRNGGQLWVSLVQFT